MSCYYWSIGDYTAERIRYESHKYRNSVNNLDYLGKAVLQYSKANGKLPDANQWCDQLMDSNLINARTAFQHPDTEGYESDFAFNRNVSEKDFSSLNGKTIILFESSGKWNLNGDQELIGKNTKRKIFVAVFLCDGTIPIYNLKSKKIMGVPEEVPLWK